MNPLVKNRKLLEDLLTFQLRVSNELFPDDEPLPWEITDEVIRESQRKGKFQNNLISEARQIIGESCGDDAEDEMKLTKLWEETKAKWQEALS